MSGTITNEHVRERRRIMGYANKDYYVTQQEIINTINHNKSEPTERDMIETEQIFSDFGIHIPKSKIPNFKSRNQMLQWRKDMIKKKLD